MELPSAHSHDPSSTLDGSSPLLENTHLCIHVTYLDLLFLPFKVFPPLIISFIVL